MAGHLTVSGHCYFLDSQPKMYWTFYLPELLTKAICRLSGDQDGTLIVP